MSIATVAAGTLRATLHDDAERGVENELGRPLAANVDQRIKDADGEVERQRRRLVGRTLVAVLENYQQADGSIVYRSEVLGVPVPRRRVGNTPVTPFLGGGAAVAKALITRVAPASPAPPASCPVAGARPAPPASGRPALAAPEVRVPALPDTLITEAYENAARQLRIAA